MARDAEGRWLPPGWVRWLCYDNYTFSDEIYIPGVTAFAERAARKWQAHSLPGPAEAPGWDQPERSPLTLAWMLSYDLSLSKDIHGVGPERDVADHWVAIAITPSWRRRIGAKAYEVFTYGTDCTCCLGYRVLLLAGVAFGAGVLCQ